MSQVLYNLIFTIDCRWLSYLDPKRTCFNKMDSLLTLMLIHFSIAGIFRTALMGKYVQKQKSTIFYLLFIVLRIYITLEHNWKWLKFIYSEKATNFCEISTIDLSYVVPVKSTVEIAQNFVAFSEYMNFTGQCWYEYVHSEFILSAY